MGDYIMTKNFDEFMSDLAETNVTLDFYSDFKKRMCGICLL